ncbi:60S ribosomal protein L24 [Acorus calamus]|uniref:60S ribosomal protein L24 n=1 Tax=Acorus calamus TaxID=4465 RepID=A0AAV9DVQ8_ACOCL|nr:60S ribosomal protein L24 [Acorus calamus]
MTPSPTKPFPFLYTKVDFHVETIKKRCRATKKPYSRSIVGATLEVHPKGTEKAQVHDAAREAALQ